MRLLTPRMSELLGQTILVENRPGAGSTVGTDYVAKQPPDGYTFLLAGASVMVTNPVVRKDLPYDPLRDFTPITTVFRSALVLFAHPSLPANDLRDLIAYAKANPGKVTFASWQLGGLNHVYLEMLRSDTGADMLHVPYKSGLDAQRDLVEGRIHMMMGANATQMAWVRAGKLKALGVPSGARLRAVNEVPTFREQGFSGYEHAGTMAIFGPAKLPPEVVKRLNSELVRILRSSDVIDFFIRVAPLAEVEPSTPEELGALVRTQSEYFGPIIRKLGIRID
jgi:tripartite-type tricarboxylate transporter receptor subunit TctC